MDFVWCAGTAFVPPPPPPPGFSVNQANFDKLNDLKIRKAAMK